MYRLFPLRHAKQPSPAISYAAAHERLAQLQAMETKLSDGAILPHCATQVLEHGEMTEHAIVLLHGFTNCPYQFQQLAPLLHQRGYTVISPRFPRHGHSDRLTTALAKLTVTELLDAASAAVDIARGYGQKVTVLGFSMGGVLAAWFAQNRADLHRVIMISPAIGIQALPSGRHRLIANVLALLPNFYQWWDPIHKAEGVKPHHAYPRFATHALAVMLRLGQTVLGQAANRPPATTELTLITNPSDPVISHQFVAQLVQAWTAHGATVTEHRFPTEWNLLHDLIDPLQPQEQVALVYPLLMAWLEESFAFSPK